MGHLGKVPCAASQQRSRSHRTPRILSLAAAVLLTSAAPSMLQLSAPAVASAAGSNAVNTVIAGGDNHSLAVGVDGSVWAWGNNTFGEVGDGTVPESATPVAVQNLPAMSAAAGGFEHTLAVGQDGSVWDWGGNENGQLGNGTTTMESCCTPARVALGSAEAVTASDYQSFALLTNGNVMAWGANGSDLGLGPNASSVVTTPTAVTGISGVKAISTSGDHTLALTTDGTVASWGNNSSGEGGIGSTTPSTISSPTRVNGLPTVTAIAAGGSHSVALASDGTVWTWGSQSYCQAGTRTGSSNLTPFQVVGLTGVVAIAAGGYHTLALKSDGTVWAWGDDNGGQLGISPAVSSTCTPTQVTALSGVKSIVAGHDHSAALLNDGSVWVWGVLGEFVGAELHYYNGPTEVTASTAMASLYSGNYDLYAVSSDGTLWAWGDDTKGQLGGAPRAYLPTPRKVSGLSTARAVAAGEDHSLALMGDGTVFAWGVNGDGELGTGDFRSAPDCEQCEPTPVQVAGLTSVTAIAAAKGASAALKSDGTVWTWGQDQSLGILGQGSPTFQDYPTPSQVVNLTNVIAIAVGDYHMLALKSDGTVWGWGDASAGELGTATVGSTGCQYGPCTGTPVQVNGLSNIVAIAAGASHSLALRADGTVWALGDDYSGELGNGTATGQIATPTQVAGLTTAYGIAAHGYQSAALQNGSVWHWGDNDDGEGGAGAQASSGCYCDPSPVRASVAGSTQVALGEDHALATTPGGAVSTWGANVLGQIGNGTLADALRPVQVFIGAGVPMPPPIGGAVDPHTYVGSFNGCFACFLNWLHTMQEEVGDPVNTASGLLTESHSDFMIDGRGIPLAFVRTYNSFFAATDGPLGYGWTFNGGASLSQDPSTGAVTVSQENGSQATFAPSNGGYAPTAPRFIATLAKRTDGSWLLTRRGTEQLVFSSAGKILTFKDRFGNTTTYGYNGSNQLTSITDPSGRSLQIAYNGSHIASVSDPSDPMGRTVSFGYDSGTGDLTTVQDSAQGQTRTTTYAYLSGHLLGTVTTPLGSVTTNTYDTSNPPRVIQQDVTYDPNDATKVRTTRFTYTGDAFSAAGGSTLVTDPQGDETLEQYANGLRTAVTRGYGTTQAATWAYAYDPATLSLVSETDPNGHETRTGYDSNGNPITVTDSLGRTTRKTYDSTNELTSVTDPKGVTTTYTYDSSGNGNLVRTDIACPDCTPAGTQTTTYHYDDTQHPNDLTRTFDPDNQPDTASSSKPWTYSYDQYGNRTTSTDPVGDTTLTCYDAIDRVVATVEPKGYAAGQRCPTGGPPSGGTPYVAYRQYDGFGEVTLITDPLGHQSSTSYDAGGNVSTELDANGNLTKYAFDLVNERTGVTLGAGTTQQTVSTITYRPDGLVAVEQDGNGNQTTYQYDAQKRVTGVTTAPTAACATGCTTAYTYDAAGNRVAKQLPGGNCAATPVQGCIEYGYDAGNEQTSITYSDGTTPNVTLGYDADGQRTSMTDGTGRSSWSYDSLHRLLSTTDGAGATVGYQYDMAGRLTQLAYPFAGQVVSRGYDAAGRLTSVTDWLGHTTRYTPDADSNVTAEAYPNGTQANTVFDAADRVASITESGLTDATGTALPVSFTYGRDGNGQLQSAAAAGVPAPVTSSYAYTPLNQLQLDAPGAGENGTYQYDAVGNPVVFGNRTVQSYDAADELTSAGQITLVDAAKATDSAGSQTSLTVDLPSPAAAGDQIVAFSNEVNSTTAQLPSGWTLLRTRGTASSGTVPLGQSLFAVKARGGEQQVQISYTGTNPKTLLVVVYRGLDTTNPFESNTSNGAVASTTVTVPALTASEPGERIVMFAGGAGSSSGQAWSSAAMRSVIQESSTSQISGAVLDQIQVQAGATGSQSATASSSGELGGILLGLRPALTTFSYDTRGDRTSTAGPSGSNALAYDQEDRLVAFGSGATYAYNGDGLRMSKTVAGRTAAFVYDEAEGLPLTLTDGATEYVYGMGGVPLEQVTAPPPAISLVGTAHGGNSPGGLAPPSSTVSVQLPGGIAADDQIIVATTFAAGLANTVATPNGYSQVGQPVVSTGTAADETVLFRRDASGNEGGTTLTLQYSAPFASALVVAVYRGVDPGAPIDVLQSGTASGSNTVSTGSAHTRYSSERLVVIQGASFLGTASTAWTPPSGMTEEAMEPDVNTVSAGIADGSAGAPGNVGPFVSTLAKSGELTTVLLGLHQPASVLYFHQDQIGSTRLLTDDAGASVATYTYDAYGKLAASTGVASTPLRYAGQYQDAESGFYELRARYYDPATAEFLSRDPLEGLTKQPYAYAGDDPVNARDASGESSMSMSPDAQHCDRGPDQGAHTWVWCGNAWSDNPNAPVVQDVHGLDCDLWAPRDFGAQARMALAIISEAAHTIAKWAGRCSLLAGTASALGVETGPLDIPVAGLAALCGTVSMGASVVGAAADTGLAIDGHCGSAAKALLDGVDLALSVVASGAAHGAEGEGEDQKVSPIETLDAARGEVTNAMERGADC